MIPALVSHVTQKVLLCRYHAVMLARGWIRSHPQRQSSNLFRWSPHGTTLESTLLGQSPHCHTMATVTSWHWVTTSPSGSRQLLYLQSVHKGLLNLFSSYVLCMQVGYYLFQTTALHTVSADLQFRNQLNEELMRSLGIKHHLTTAYHPQVTYAQQDSCTAFLQ